MAATTLALSPRYRGTELIASGGMADVYVATDATLERQVAVKILSERFAADSDVRARFTREARIAARLSNVPNVVTIFDVGDFAGRPAIVMEYLPGGTLADRMRAGRIPPALALAWLEQAAHALDAAHAEGVVHRDVKPANLMLGADGDVRVTDFGIARVSGDSALTSVGTILGTSGYMAPEQAVGGRATAASDRYGLAVVAFELLSGRRPYLGETFAAEAAAHATALIPEASSFDRTLPPAVDDVLARGLAKDPGARPGSCSEMVVDLRAAFFASADATVANAPPVSTAPSRQRRLSRIVALAAVVGAIAVAGLALAALANRGDRSPARQAARKPAASLPITTRATPTTAAAPSGAALNDQGFKLLQHGNMASALPLLERAVTALRGTGTPTEAFASYNLALARLATGDCNGVRELVKRSEQLQGKRPELTQLRHEAEKGCHAAKQDKTRDRNTVP